jgi:hypothetical protein
MEEIAYTIFNFSILFVFAYPFILLVQTDNKDDELFSFYNGEIKEENLINQIKALGKLKGENYESQLKQFHLFFADNVISDREYKEIERFITMGYFDNFKDRWIPFKKADPVLILVCFYSILAAFLLLFMIVFKVEHLSDLSHVKIVTPEFLTNIVSFIGALLIGVALSYLFLLLFLGAYSMMFTGLSMLFPKKGNLVRRSYILDEMIKCLKPGGRYTPVILGSNSYSEDDKVMHMKMMLQRKNRKR